MSTGTRMVALQRFTCNRQRFESRLRFFKRCQQDIVEDFHKQYGPFYEDWELTLEASEQYLIATEDYLRSRDIIVMEFKLLMSALEDAQTTYAIKKAEKRFDELLEICQSNDATTLAEIDEDISAIRTVYQMIAMAECEPEEE